MSCSLLSNEYLYQPKTVGMRGEMPLCQCLIPGLVWPKKPYDYMYAEGERLLRDFPVQATLEFASESDTDSDSDSDSDSDVVDFDHMQSNDRENSMQLQARP